MKKKIIDIDTHTFFRMIERGTEFGLDLRETKERTFKTIRRNKLAKRKHKSKKNLTYYNYFKDNLSVLNKSVV